MGGCEVAERIEIDARLVEERIMTLARIGECHETGVCRPTYSPEWVEAQELVLQWYRDIGMEARYDAVGTAWGKLEGREPGKSIVSGSHIDTQLPGGRYDGALGVIAALTAVEALQKQFGRPRKTVEVLSFCEEEGTAFPGARFWGSRAITGRIAPEDPELLIGFSGESIGATMRRLGFDPDGIPAARRDDIDAFIELHIEQGPILEQQEIPVGIVSIINGSYGFNVTVTGVANHAGARPMDMRQDPMVAAAEMIQAVNRNALAMGRPAVSTVGRIAAEPNLAPVIPEKVMFSIDCRHNVPDKLEALAAAHQQSLREIAAKHGVQVEWTQRPPLMPVACDPDIVRTLEEAAEEQGIPALTMPSGALHDTQRMAEVARVSMVFVQSKDGRSHTPAEFSSIEHCVAGIQVLAAALHKLAW
jgi:allantoate deiminase